MHTVALPNDVSEILKRASVTVIYLYFIPDFDDRRSGVNAIKLFFFVSDVPVIYARMFVPASLFSLI